METARKVAGWSWVACLCVAVACGPSKGKGKVGAFCDNDSDCESGLCFENQCLDPDGDEDGDGLKNGIEAHQTGTNPLRADTDNDGSPDLEEVGDIASPTDTDGDGLIDALESSLMLADDDRDCLPDEYDPNNDVPDSGKEREIATLFCQKEGGVCSERVDEVQAACVEGEVQCDYSAVAGYQAVETWCDAKDNDCDGQTDAGLTSTTEGTCKVAGVCGSPGTQVQRDCVDGQWVCRYSDLPNWEEVETRFDGLDNDCDGQTDEGMADQPCEVANEFGRCPGTKVFLEGQVVCDGPTPASEECDGVDNDCDGQIDEGLSGLSCDITNEHGTCNGTTSCAGGQLDCLAQVPAPEACDALDNDCDGQTDPEGAAGCQMWFYDKDGDGYGMTGNSKCLCMPSGFYMAGQAGDCDDTNSMVGLPSQEACNNSDDDCDGQIDEGLSGLSCDITNEHGTCNGTTSCAGGQIKCVGQTPAKDVCNSLDDNCDGQTDENDICLKTSSVKGTVRDGATSKPVAGARVEFFASIGLQGGLDDQRLSPSETLLTDSQGRFEVSLIPGGYVVTVVAHGYKTAQTWTFVLMDQDTMPLDIALTPEDTTSHFVSVCGRVYDAGKTEIQVPIQGASVTLYGNDFDNALASASSGPQGFYCISGVSGLDASGSPFERFGLKASKPGFLPGMAESVPNEPDTVYIVDIYLSPLPPWTQTFLHEDFEQPDLGWNTDAPASGVGWQWLKDGQHVNEAMGKCVMPPAQFEDCTKDPSDPTDRCAVCSDPAEAACIPVPGALPNAYAGSGAFWFGNPQSANFLPDSGTCEPLSGGTGGPVGGSLTSPWIKTASAYPLYLSFFSAWEIESVDPQGPPDGYDQMLIEVQGSPAMDWVLLGYLNPRVDVNSEPYQPYTSGGFNQAPIWVNYVFDLTPWSYYPEIRIQFRFDSKDEQYNGFRGWLVDEVEVFGVIPTQ